MVNDDSAGTIYVEADGIFEGQNELKKRQFEDDAKLFVVPVWDTSFLGRFTDSHNLKPDDALLRFCNPL